MHDTQLTADQQWKSDLILAIARRKGFRGDQLDDAYQQVFLHLLTFKYDPEKAHGASEKTIVAQLITKLLVEFQRTEIRRRRREEKVRRVCGASQYEPATDDSHLEHERRFELRADVHTVMKKLTRLERDICTALTEGWSQDEIAEMLSITRYDVRRGIERIRATFTELGVAPESEA